jgi:hypothetical protein
MKIISCLIIWSLFEVTSFAQSREIKWWETQSFGSEAINISRVLREGKNLYLAAGLFRRFGTSDPRLFMLDENGIIVKKEILNNAANGDAVTMLGFIPHAGELYGYYFTKSGTAIVFRDRIDKSSLTFAGEELKLLEGKQTSTDMINPIWEKEEKMKEYFGGDEDFRFLDDPHLGRHVIIKRNSFAGKQMVELKIVVLRDNLELLNQLDIKLNSTNTNTRLYDVVTDSDGGVYLILGDFAEKMPVISLHYYPPGNGEVKKTSINGIKYLRTMKGICYKGGLLLTGLRSENKKETESDHLIMWMDPSTLKVMSEHVMGTWDDDDLIHLVSNGETCLVIHERHTPSVWTTTSTGKGQWSTRYSNGFAASLIDAERKVLWTESVANAIAAPGGGLLYDAIFPFVHDGRYFMIQNTHPETHALVRTGGKLKTATYGKERFATELITFHDDGKIKREYIYQREEKVVTIPIHTRHTGDGRYLFYGDKASIGNSIQFGMMELGID